MDYCVIIKEKLEHKKEKGCVYMYWGYHRCSTKEQNLDRGIAEITKYFDENITGEKYKIFTDKQTGKNFNRPQYQLMKEVAEPGDEIVITEVDRLGRNKEDTLKELKYFKEKGVIVKILEIPTTLVDYSKLDNNLAKMMMETINNLLIELYSTLAHAEMEKRVKRQREGIEQMKARGDWDKYGRKQLISERQFSLAFKNVLSGEMTAVECMKELNISKTTFYNMRKKYLGSNDLDEVAVQ